MFTKLAESRSQLAQLKTQLENSQKGISESDKLLKKITVEYSSTSKGLRDSLQRQQNSVFTLQQIYMNMHKSYQVIQDSNRIQGELLAKNNNLIVSSSKELSKLNDSIFALRFSLTKSSDSLHAALADVELMRSSLENLSGQAAKIKPLSRSRTLFGHKDNRDKQLLEFAIWLDIPKELKKNILNVTYKYNLPASETVIGGKSYQSITVTDARSDFKTTYTSWGCVQNMIIEVSFKNHLSTPIYFDLCNSLNNPSIKQLPAH